MAEADRPARLAVLGAALMACHTIGGTLGSLAAPCLDLWHHPAGPGWWEPIRCERLPVTRQDPLGQTVRLH